MRIASYLNVTQEEVDSRQHNIWIGVSLGNKYFTKDNIRTYIQWALSKTRNTVLVLIADAIQAINLEVFDDRSPEVALQKAMAIGGQKYEEVQQIISELSPEDAARVHLTRWSDVTNNERYQKSVALAREFYETNPEFKDHIIQSVKAGRPDKVSQISHLSSEKINRLAEYILGELPHFVVGVEGHDGEVYTLNLYPGLSLADEVFIGLNTGMMFPELAKKLNIQNKIGILEAYVE